MRVGWLSLLRGYGWMNDLGMNRLSLRFAPDLEREFERINSHEAVLPVRWTLFVGTAVFIWYAVMDLTASDGIDPATPVDLSILGLYLAGFVASWLPGFWRVAPWVGGGALLAYCFDTLAAMLLYPATADGLVSDLWAISGCVLFAFIGLRLGFVRGCVFCIIGTLVLLAGVVLSPVKDLPDVWLRLTMYGFILLLAVFAGYFVDSYIRRDFIQQRLLAAERAKSDRLLFNLLPRPIADRLRETPGTIADTHAEVSVVFADLVGFTALSTRVSPTAMVETLNTIFSAFDRLAERLGLEKIKTTGDGYHAVAGLPSPRPDHAEAAAELALGMHATIDHIARQTGWDLRLRVGIASGGPVVAGVIGQTKYVYEVWGDVVNTASRMESHGLPGAIQVTEETRRRLDGRYAFIDRGLIEVKNKGPLHTYFLQRRDAAEADDGRLPELTAAHGRAVR